MFSLLFFLFDVPCKNLSKLDTSFSNYLIFKLFIHIVMPPPDSLWLPSIHVHYSYLSTSTGFEFAAFIV